jgi:hypothetical protein
MFRITLSNKYLVLNLNQIFFLTLNNTDQNICTDQHFTCFLASKLGFSLF